MTDAIVKDGSARLYYHSDTVDLSASDEEHGGEVLAPVPKELANLVSSLCVDGLHRPALDIDFPCELVPSSTPGCFHLYIDKGVSTEQYMNLLEALANAGICQTFWANRARTDGQSFLRPPWVKKPKRENPDDHCF